MAPAAPSSPPSRRSAALAVFLGLLVPGAGQAYVGNWRDGLAMATGILGLFLGGLFLTAFTCVSPETRPLEFVGQAFLLGPTALVLHLTDGLRQATPLPYYDAGRLYVTVSGLLNLVVLCDVWRRVVRTNDRVHRWHSLHEARQLRRRAFEVRSARAALDGHALHVPPAWGAANGSEVAAQREAATPTPPPTARAAPDKSPAESRGDVRGLRGRSEEP